MVALNVKEEVHTLADFTQNSAEFIEQLEETGQPVTLTVNGKAKVIIQDAQAYRRMLELADQMEMLEGIQESLDSMKQGKGISLHDFKKRMSEKYGLPMERPGQK